MNRVKVIYFTACPNAQKAQDTLTKGKIPFDVIVQDKLEENSPYREYSSPTILDGTSLIFGQKIGANSAACSVDKFDENLILEKLRYSKKSSSGVLKKGRFGTIGTMGSGLIVGLCPACIPAVGALLSSLGVGFLVQDSFLRPLLFIFLILAMAGLLYSYLKEHHNIWPLVFGATSGVALYLGRYVYFGGFINPALMYGGVVAIISVGFWNLYLRRKTACASCTPTSHKEEVIL